MTTRTLARWLATASVLGSSVWPLHAQPPARPDGSDTLRATVGPFVAEHCAACHGARLRTVGLDLEALVSSETPNDDLDTWARVLGRINSGQMPPPGRPRPSSDEVDTVASSIDALLTGAGYRDQTAPDPGRVTVRRLNRVEYANTIRSLLGVSGDWASDFPLDDAGYGFDNNGDVLSVSPLLMEKYLSAARRIARRAVEGEPVPEEPTLLVRYMGRRSRDAGDGLDDDDVLPYSMRGALYGTHQFAWDAEYEFRFRAANYRRSRRQLIAQGLLEPDERDRFDRAAEAELTEDERRARFLEDARQSQPPVPLVATLDGEVILEELIEGSNAFGYERGEFSTRVRLSAGEHSFRFSYPDTANLDDPRENLLADGRRVLYVDYVDIVGPFDVDRSPPASYDRIFVCQHRPGEHDESCAREVVTTLARRAYRRPPTNAEIDTLVGLVREAQSAGDTFESGVQLAIQAVLLSPHFLFRVEHDPGDGDVHPVSDHELATRLSYFLWADMPDAELLAQADAGRLLSPAVLREQTARMLEDPRASSLVDDFAAQWLQLRTLARARPDPTRFPTVDDELRDAMDTETRLFLQAMMREDRSMLDLLDAPFSFLNGPLARHYGIPGVDGERFRRVALDGTERSGLLSQASILTVSSYPTRTSPVLRGKWVLENLLGTPPPEPPPDVPALEADGVDRSLSLREQMEQHRANPACAACHRQIDPLGFGLERYDATGAWRTHDGASPVDDHGVLPDGTSFEGPAELKAVLKARAPSFRRALAEKLLTYALGRGLEPYDRDAVDGVVEAARLGGDRWSAYVTGVVESPPFRMRRSEGAQ